MLWSSILKQSCHQLFSLPTWNKKDLFLIWPDPYLIQMILFFPNWLSTRIKMEKAIWSICEMRIEDHSIDLFEGSMNPFDPSNDFKSLMLTMHEDSQLDQMMILWFEGSMDHFYSWIKWFFSDLMNHSQINCQHGSKWRKAIWSICQDLRVFVPWSLLVPD